MCASTTTEPVRLLGIDVARALAILGMILVNVRGKAHPTAAVIDWLPLASRQLDGKAAALFLLLAGVGVSLRSARARESAPGLPIRASERIALLERAAILFALGMVHAHIWKWDILHFYGVYLAFAAGLMFMPSRILWPVALAFGLGGVGLQLGLDWWQPTDQWTFGGTVSRLFFNGNYAVFPWMAFLVVGMWLGRQPLREQAYRRRVLTASLLALAAIEWLDHATGPTGILSDAVSSELADQLCTFPRPARPGFVVSGAAAAVAVVCLSIEAGERWERSNAIVSLVATGQMAFTIYVAHTIAILVPATHGVFDGATIELVLGYGAVLFGLSMVASLWWRSRWRYGPLEGLIRQITERDRTVNRRKDLA